MTTSNSIPAHVPPEMVRDFSIYTSPGMAKTPNGCPQAAIAAGIHDGPPIFYAANNTREGRGTWVVVSAEHQRQVLQDAATFSSNKDLHAEALGETIPLIPFEIDPPQHTAFRAMLNPLLSPKAVARMEPMARARAVELIEGFRARGHCEVMEEFAFPFAVMVFLTFLGLPYSRSPEFLGWAEDLLRGTTEERNETTRRVHQFMIELAELRRREPTDDFMTYLVETEFQGRKLTDQEIRGIGFLLFIAGLDTVAAAIGLDMYYLATHPEKQQALRDNPEFIASAVEEMFRAFPTIGILRVATRDVELLGAPIKRGDWLLCGTYIANRDPAEFPDPETIDFAREDNRHVLFGYGPHRCLGSHLARRELIIGIEEFLARLPAFAIKEGTTPITHGGFVFGVDNVEISWPTANDAASSKLAEAAEG
jgi:cytochrome P450